MWYQIPDKFTVYLLCITLSWIKTLYFNDLNEINSKYMYTLRGRLKFEVKSVIMTFVLLEDLNFLTYLHLLCILNRVDLHISYDLTIVQYYFHKYIYIYI